MSHTYRIANDDYIYQLEMLKMEIIFYLKIIPIDTVIVILLIFNFLILMIVLKKTDYFKSYDKVFHFLKEMIIENGGYLGIILIAIIIADVNMPDYGKHPKFYLRLRDVFKLPHIVYVIPALTAPLLLWKGINLQRKRKIDYLAIVTLIIWMFLLAFLIFIIILFYDADFHMT